MSPVPSCPSVKKDRTDRVGEIQPDIPSMREMICENIGYGDLKLAHPHEERRIDEIVEIMLDVLLTESGTVYIDGMQKPIALVKSNLMKVRYPHAEFVLWQYGKQTGRIQKKHKYIMSMLYHSVMELDAHYTNLVQYHMSGGKE